MSNHNAERDALVLANLGLAGRISIEWDGRIEGMSREDIEQECRLALLRAAARWHPGRLKFATWAWVCMERSLRRIRDNAGLIRVPYYLAPLLAEARRLVGEGKSAGEAVAELQTPARRRRLIRFALDAWLQPLPEDH